MPRGGARPGGGRPKGSTKPVEQHTIYKSITIACPADECDAIKALAEKSGKSVSRYLVDLALKNN